MKIISRVFLILLGGAMVVGGGFCAFSNAYLGLTDYYGASGLLFVLFVISLAVAGAGVLLLREVGAFERFRRPKSGAPRNPEPR